jgi:hypothetical protein
VYVLLQAGSVVQQSLSQIRTVAAYNGEEAAYNQYNSKLDTPQKVRGSSSLQESCKCAAIVLSLYGSAAVAGVPLQQMSSLG